MADNLSLLFVLLLLAASFDNLDVTDVHVDVGWALLLSGQLLRQVLVFVTVIMELAHAPVRNCRFLLVFLRRLRGRKVVAEAHLLKLRHQLGLTRLALVSCLLTQASGVIVYLRLDMLNGCRCLLLGHLIIPAAIDLLRTLLVLSSARTHRVSHHLVERRVAFSALAEFEELFRFLVRLLLLVFLETLQVGLGKLAAPVWLPINTVKLLGRDRHVEHLRAVGTEDVESIVNLEALVQDGREHVATAGRPLDHGRARVLRLTGFLRGNAAVGADRPEVDLALGDVAKAAEHDQISEWTEADHTAEATAELEERHTFVTVVESGLRWLLTGDDDEELAISRPCHILNG